MLIIGNHIIEKLIIGIIFSLGYIGIIFKFSYTLLLFLYGVWMEVVIGLHVSKM
jgi:hypothetical protein